MQQQPCKGTNADGSRCKRIHKLNANNYCHSHVGQDPLHNLPEVEEQEFVFGSLDSHLQVGSNDASIQNSSSSSDLFGAHDRAVASNERRGNNIINNNNNNNNNDGGDADAGQRVERTISSAASSSLSVPPSSGGAQIVERANLPRCGAVAKSTSSPCMKFVSLPGEHFCPKHGGKQIKPLSGLPKCGAISKTTRQPCQNNVTFAGQRLCHVHGGAVAGGGVVAIAAAARSPPAPANVPSGTNPLQDLGSAQRASNTNPLLLLGNDDEESSFNDPRCWAEIQSVCLRFLMEIHPTSKCQCASSSNPCQGMRIVSFMQALTQLAQQQSATSIMSSIFDAKMPDLLRFIPRRRMGSIDESEESLSSGGGGLGGNNKQTGDAERGLFSDLFLAVNMFGRNIFFLPRFFHHIQKEAKLHQPPFAREARTGNEVL